MTLRTIKKNNLYWIKSLIFHFRPGKIQERQLKFTFTWGLGGISFVLIFLLFGTGLMLKFFYIPLPDMAYESLIKIQDQIQFGPLIRNIHHWSSHFLVLIAFLHFLRVFFTNAYNPPRRFNWLIGLVLFTTILLSNFTGYLLPWDQLAYWAITICTGMLDYIPFIGTQVQHFIRGGTDVGPATLSNFYTIHTAVLPLVITILMAYHFWGIRKAKGLVSPHGPDENLDKNESLVPVIPDLLVRELVIALFVIAIVIWASIFFNAPMLEKANPGLSPNPTKAPWYFAGFQELLLYFHPLFSLFIIPIALAIALILIPYFGCSTDTAGIWFNSLKGRWVARVTIMTSIFVTPPVIIVKEFFKEWTWLPGIQTWISNGLFPVLFVLVFIMTFYWWIKKYFRVNKNEAVQSIFLLLVTMFVILTVIGIWFRGAGMALVWPWNRV